MCRLSQIGSFGGEIWGGLFFIYLLIFIYCTRQTQVQEQSWAEYTVGPGSAVYSVLFWCSAVLQRILSIFTRWEKDLYFQGLSISKANESNLQTEKQSSGPGRLKRKTGVSSFVKAFLVGRQITTTAWKHVDGLLTTSEHVGCFGKALQKAAFELSGKVKSTFGHRTEVWSTMIGQRKPNLRNTQFLKKHTV